jgi:hypothetical protein
MPRSPMRLLLMRSRLDRLLRRGERGTAASRRRAQRLQTLREGIAERLARHGFPTPVL